MKVDPRLGTELGGYRIEELIGRGGMSAVYLAEDLRLGRKVALKLLSPELAEDERFRERFVRESRLAASLEHPNIVPIYEAGESDGVLFIAMRYIGGTDLKALIRSEGALEPPRAMSLLYQVADALDAAHARGLVHRDVKPANVLVSPPPVPGATEHAYLSDFGLTKRASSDSGLTGTGQFVGTLDYAAPEQFEGRPLDARTDVYSLACVLFECLTGEVPYRREQDAALMYAHLMAPVPVPTEVNPDLPQALDEVIARGMAKSAEDRFATAGELVRAARDALGVPGRESQSSSLGGVVKTERVGAARSGRTRIVAVGAALGVAVVVAIILAITSGGKGGLAASPSPSSTGVATTARKASVVAFDPKTGQRMGAPVALGRGTGTLTTGFGSVWVANTDEDTVTRIDPRTRKVLRAIHIGDRPLGIAVDDDDPNVWVMTTDRLWAIDPVTNAVVATIELGVRPNGIAVGSGSIWITYAFGVGAREEMLRIDPRAHTVAERIAVAPYSLAPVGVAVAGSGVWIIHPSAGIGNPGYLVRIDPISFRRRVNTIGSPVALAVDDSAVWVLDVSGAVSRFDPSSRRTVARIGSANGASGIAVGEGGVWVFHRLKGSMIRIDPEAGTAGDPIAVGGSPSSVAVGEGLVWVRLDGAL